MGLLDFLFGKKKNNSTVSKNKYAKEYYDLDKLILETDDLVEAYNDIKKFRNKFHNKEVRDENHLEQIILDHFKKFDGDKIIQFFGDYSTIESILGTYLNDLDSKKVKFNGYVEIEQYHSLAQKIYTMLNQTMLEKAITGDLNLD